MAITKINTPEIFDLGATNTALRLPSGSTASRPTNPNTGEWRYNTDDNYVEYWDGSAWFQIDYEAPAPTCTTNTINYPTAVSAYYKMEDATDQTGNYNGTATNVNFNVAGKFGNAGEFNGISSKLDTGYNLTSTTFSVSVWFNTTDSAAPIIGDYDASGTGASDREGFQLLTTKVALYKNDVQIGSHTFSSELNNGNWRHVVITNDGTTCKVYVDGSEDGTINSTTWTDISVKDIHLGYTQRSPIVNWLNGKIDQVRIFPSALTAAQVTQLYNEIQCAPTIVPSEHFNVNTYVGNSSTQAIDAKFNEAAAFNGSSSYISLANANTILGNPAGQSISVWANFNSVTTNGFNSTALLASNNGVGAADWQITLYDGKIYADYFDAAGAYRQRVGSTVLSANTWYHFVIIFDSVNPNVIQCYVNGSAETMTNITSNGTFSGNIDNSNIPITIGRRDLAGGTWYMNGKIDQVRLFNTALTQQQVTDLYTNETTATAQLLDFPVGAGCIAAYELDGDASDVGGTYGGIPTDIGYTGLKFQPDLVWIKRRNTTEDHALFDSVRGALKMISSNLTAAEYTTAAPFEAVSSFDSNGFTSGDNGATNRSPNTYVAWCFKGGGAAVSNTNGTITSQVSANQDAGFSIVSYTGTGSVGNFGHGLSSQPELVIVKRTSLAEDWFVLYDTSNTPPNYMKLNTTASGGSSSAVFPSPATSTVVNVGTDSGSNTSGQDYISYCFHSVEGFSKIGSYTGTGTAGNSVVTGFEPAFLLVKRSDSGDNWLLFDNKRNPNNPTNLSLIPNNTAAESVGNLGNGFSFLSNGFSVESIDSGINANGGTYIFLAIAAEPAPEPVLANSFEPVIYTGNGGTQNVTTSFQPDLVWIKNRSSSQQNHAWFDLVRGAQKEIRSDSTVAEQDYSATSYSLTSFDSNSFTVSDISAGNYNVNGAVGGTYSGAAQFVAWCWKAAGIPAINQNGTIDSIVNANPAAGFSIVKYTGNGTSSQNVGHGLSSAPEFIIIKNTTTAQNWLVYNTVTNLGDSSLDYGYLSLNYAFNHFGNSGLSYPTSTVFNVGTSSFDNSINDVFIAYCFHSVDGYQKVGSFSYSVGYSENVGFEPRFLLMKKTSSTGSWYMIDNKRVSGTNNYGILANSSAAEDTGTDYITFTSTGFTTTYSDSGTYIYLAIK